MKIKVIGNKGCSRCEITKNILNQNGLKYDYVIYNELPKDEQADILIKAKEKGVVALPILLVNDEIKENVQEVLKCK